MSWADRAVLSALIRLIPGGHRRGLRLIVSPRTVLRSHAPTGETALDLPQAATGAATDRRGDPGAVVEMARDNPTWGYRRICGELVGLGYRVAPSTVWKLLREAGIEYAPSRAGPS